MNLICFFIPEKAKKRNLYFEHKDLADLAKVRIFFARKYERSKEKLNISSNELSVIIYTEPYS